MDPKPYKYPKLSQEQIDADQIKSYRLGTIVFWTLFGVNIVLGIFCFVYGIIKLTILLGQEGASVGGYVVVVVAGGILFLVSMLCLGLAISCTNNLHKAKHHIARNQFEDPQ